MFETRSERRPRDTRAFRRLRVSRAPVRFVLALARLAPKITPVLQVTSWISSFT